MSGTLWGADVAQLRALAQHFSKTADLLQQQSVYLGGQINSNPAWKGEDAQRFRSDWNSSHRMALQHAASALKQESRKLLDNANEQEKASNGVPGSGGGPIPAGPGGPLGLGPESLANPWGPDWLANGSPFRDGWGIRSQFKSGLDLPKNLFGLSVMGAQGWDVFKNADKWGKLASRSVTYNLFDSATDVLGLKNLQKYFPSLNRFSGLLEESTWLFKGQGPLMEGLGKGGLGRGLGWLGVGLNAFDTAKFAAEGKPLDAGWSAAKTGLGIACFAPPPVGTVCQVVSAGIAIYEIPAVRSVVDGALKDTGEIVAKKAVTTAAFVAETGKNLADMGESAAKFLGIG